MGERIRVLFAVGVIGGVEGTFSPRYPRFNVFHVGADMLDQAVATRQLQCAEMRGVLTV